jgi:hypothetical protein
MLNTDQPPSHFFWNVLTSITDLALPEWGLHHDELSWSLPPASVSVPPWRLSKPKSKYIQDPQNTWPLAEAVPSSKPVHVVPGLIWIKVFNT